MVTNVGTNKIQTAWFTEKVDVYEVANERKKKYFFSLTRTL